MLEVLEHPPVKHPRPCRSVSQVVGIIGRVRRWHPLAGRAAPPLLAFDFTLPGRYRALAARALWSLHRDIPWYSWQADDLGQRRVRA